MSIIILSNFRTIVLCERINRTYAGQRAFIRHIQARSSLGSPILIASPGKPSQRFLMTNSERALEVGQIADSIERRSERLKNAPSAADGSSEVAHALKEMARALHHIAAYITKA